MSVSNLQVKTRNQKLNQIPSVVSQETPPTNSFLPHKKANPSVTLSFYPQLYSQELKFLSRKTVTLKLKTQLTPQPNHDD